MSAVLVRQSLSLARAEAERLSIEQSRQCVDGLRAVSESALISDPDLPFAPPLADSSLFAGARAVSESGVVIERGSAEEVGVSGCVDGFDAAGQRVLFRLPSAERPTLSALYAASEGSSGSGTVVEYGLDSVSRFQVWSESPLDVATLFSDGSARDDTDGTGTQPGASSMSPGAAGVVGLVEPEVTAPVGTSLAPVSGLSVSFAAPGERRYRITAVVHPRNEVPGEVMLAQLLRNPGGVGQRTVQAGLVPLANTSDPESFELTVVDVPPAGVVTYRVDARFALQQGSNVSDLTHRPYLLVEDVGPADISDPARVLPADAPGGLVAISPERYPDGAFNPPLGDLWQMPQLTTSPTGQLAEVGPSSGGAPMEVTFAPAAGRAYRVVSLVKPYAPTAPGAVVLHRVELDDTGTLTPLASALTPLANQANAFSHQLDAVWVAPEGVSGSVTVRTRMGLEAPSGEAYNYVGSGLNPYLAVFDLGPFDPAAVFDPAAAPKGPAGLAALVAPDGFASGELALVAPEGQALASATVEGRSGRVLRISSLVQPASDVPGDAGSHVIRRGETLLQGVRVAPANDTNVFASQTSSLDVPATGSVGYEVAVSFTSGAGSVLSLPEGFVPRMFVEDLGVLGANEIEGLTELAGAIYSSGGVRVFFDESGGARQVLGVLLGVDADATNRSPRHLQVISPGVDPGPSLSPNVSIYSNTGASSRLPSETALGSLGRLSGRGSQPNSDLSTGGPDEMRLTLANLIASVADRAQLACSGSTTYDGLCLSAGQALSAGSNASARPAGVVGYATPTVGVSSEVPRSGDPAPVAGQSVSFVADGTRMYRVTSVVRVASDQPGDLLDHRIVRNDVAVQAGLFAQESVDVPIASTLVKFDVPAAGLVTYRSAVRLSASAATPGSHVASGEGATFILVEDVGPAGGAEPPFDGAGGIVALQAPSSPTSGFVAGQLSPVPGQQALFQAPGGRRYEVVSTVRPSSTLAGNTARHVLGRVDSSVNVLREEVRELGVPGSVGISQLLAADAPPSGPVTYRSFLEFSAGVEQLENSNWVLVPSVRPALVVLDAGPQVPASSPPDFPAGIIASTSQTTAQITARPGRIYRVEAQATFDPAELILPEGYGPDGTAVVRISLWRLVGLQEQEVQQAKLVLEEDGPVRSQQLVALDLPSPELVSQASYQLRFEQQVAAGPSLFAGPRANVFVADLGPAAQVSGATGSGFVISGAASWVPTVPRSAGLARAAFAQAPQTVSDTPTVVDGQTVRIDSDGNRRYRITSVLHPSSTLSDEVLRHEIVRGEGSGTAVVQTAMSPVSNVENSFVSTVVMFDTPPAGQVSYGTRASFAEEGVLQAGGANRGVIMVEDVGPALGGSVPDSGGAGLRGDVAFASGPDAPDFLEGVSVAPVGQETTVEMLQGRRYTVVSNVQPFSLSQDPVEAATAVFHRIIRVDPDGSESVAVTALVDLANPINPFSHTLEHTLTGDLSGLVTFRTELEFFNGAGGNLVDVGFRPFVAVVDVGVDPPAGETPGTLPEGVLSVTGAAAPDGSAVDGDLLVVDVTDADVTVPGGRLYRASSTVHPSFRDDADDFSPLAFTHQLLRCVQTGGVTCVDAEDFIPVQEGVGHLVDVGTTTAPPGEPAPLEPVAYTHSLTAVDAPTAASAQVTYRVRLIFPAGGTAQVASASEYGGTFTTNIPQLVVEDMGLAQELSDVYGFTPASTPLELVGSAASALSSRAPADALSFLVTAVAGDELSDPALQVSSCPTPTCDEASATATFRIEQPSSGLMIFDGHTTLTGHLSRPATIIAGSVSRPADMVVDVAMTLDAAVQLVATDRIVLKVPPSAEEAMFAADLVALGLGPQRAVDTPFSATGSWTQMVSIAGSIAAPKVDLVEAFSTFGPVRLVPRAMTGQAPWAVGFSREWRPLSTRPATLTEQRELFGQ